MILCPEVYQDLELIKKWIAIHPYPKLSVVKNFIQQTFKFSLCYRSLVKLFERIDYKIEEGDPLDQERYFADTNLINFFYSNLFSFFQTYKIPSHFVYNLDEEGHDQFADAINELVVVPKDHKGKPRFPVAKKADHTTFLACISAGGEYMKPLIITKRQTVDSQICHLPIHDKIVIETSDSGYINSNIFDKWMNNVFFFQLYKKKEIFLLMMDLRFFCWMAVLHTSLLI